MTDAAPTPTTTFCDDIAFIVPSEKYVFRVGPRWSDVRVGKDGIAAHLTSLGLDPKDAANVLKQRLHHIVHEVDCVPNEEQLHQNAHGQTVLNTWVPPTLTPAPGEYPSIERVLEFLTGNDEKGLEWLSNWLALKVQNPVIVPKVAVVFTTKPGGGKGTFFRVVSEMLGTENCVSIDRGSIESRFNTTYAGRLFVLADEVVGKDRLSDISERLKIQIDSQWIIVEGKGKDQRVVRNRAAWVFASNDDLNPVSVEQGDRRYTVFSNHAPAAAQKAFCDTLYKDDKTTPTDAFYREMQAFYYDLLNMEVDRRLVASPYENEARREMVEASLPGHQAFIQHVDANGVDELLTALRRRGELTEESTQWDFGEDGIATGVLYKAYVEFCQQSGQKPLKVNKFGMAAKKAWPQVRKHAGGGRQVYCYTVRRGAGPAKEKPAGTVVPLRTADAR